MTAYGDHCDYCGIYVDPIGGDLAHADIPADKLWCGVCDNGNQYLADKYEARKT